MHTSRLKVEAYDSSELVVEVVVSGGGGSLYYRVGTDLGLFACLSALLGDEVGNGLSVNSECLELFNGLELVSHNEVHEFVGEANETSVLGNEVSLTVEGEHCCEVSVVLGDNDTLRSLTVLTLSGYCLTFFTEDFNGCLDVAVGFGEGFFAVHQAGTCEVAQLGDFCHCNCHNYMMFW